MSNIYVQFFTVPVYFVDVPPNAYDANIFWPANLEDFMKPVPRGLNPEELKSLPLKNQDEIHPSSVCSICLESLKNETEKVRGMVACEHLYHESCIFEWLKEAKTCPLCRTEHQNRDRKVEKNETTRVVDTSDSYSPISPEVISCDEKPRENDEIELECGLSSMGCCWESSQSEISSNFVMMENCQHVYHSSCVEGCARIQDGFQRSNSSTRLKCPLCRIEGGYDAI